MNDLRSYAVQITGIVQGVGMRPHICKAARQLNISGWVGNRGATVIMEIAGCKTDIREFLAALLKKPPVGAKICSIKMRHKPYSEFDGFCIINSSAGHHLYGFIPPDAAICDECRSEMYDSTNRRYLYPFTNCASCGPRYSIIKSLPYDRINTSMSSFEMCPTCRNEYENPESRRFHAQTNCCPACGPRAVLLDNKGVQIDDIQPILRARQLLQEGRLIAIKGIGGYHLACDGCNAMAIDLLRKRKRRPEKPFAIMASNMEAVKLICSITKKEEEVLASRQAPIVLLKKRHSTSIPHNIAPGINRLGVMLPYNPLHQLLFHENLKYLVMTSGNISGMPICYKDEDALEKLKDVADFFLIHNREILTPIDDSVVRVFEGKEMVSRSARGYSPSTLPIDSDCEIMAVGAEQKSSVCLLHNGYAYNTQFLGDLEEMCGYDEYLSVIERTKMLLGADPRRIGHDQHAGYLSTKYALEQSADRLPIQHHHAHMAACMAEHGLNKDVIGIIYDGTGLGLDAAVWGGEFLVGSRSKFKRAGHWKYVMLQGGDSAVKEPWKSAVSYLYAAGICKEELFEGIEPLRVRAVQNAIKHNINCFRSSSMGRLFDCVSALVTKRTHITYDAQAAIELESIIDPDITDSYQYAIDERDRKLEIGFEDIISGIVEDLKGAKAASHISAKFHNTVCEATVDCACRIRDRYNLNDVVLGGGVFENIYLLTSVKNRLKHKGFHIYVCTQVPANDGGIALGQAAAAAQMLKEGNYVLGSSSEDYIR